ncbi:MAG: KpsF/GutQ family sugar-phosphate isomerase [Pirellulaceae bacterium]
MAAQARRATPLIGSDDAQTLRRGREILLREVAAIEQLSGQLDHTFCKAVSEVLGCMGHVVVTGMGKAGIVGQKLAASLSSTGTPSHFLHPAEAVHGDLGCVRPGDLVIVLSYSGETEEVTRLLPVLRTNARIVAITARVDSTLGKAADITLTLGEHNEACALGLAPTTTTTAMLALGDALAMVVSEKRGFTREQFARFHPAGNLGRQLATVCEVMRPLTACRVAQDSLSLREVLVQVSRPGRRTGAVMLIDATGILTGIFTDSDLARLLERSQEAKLNGCVADVMTRSFTTVAANRLVSEAVHILAQSKLSELPVVDATGRPLGILDITDLVAVASHGLLTEEKAIDEKHSTPAVTGLRVLRIDNDG